MNSPPSKSGCEFECRDFGLFSVTITVVREPLDKGSVTDLHRRVWLSNHT